MDHCLSKNGPTLCLRSCSYHFSRAVRFLNLSTTQYAKENDCKALIVLVAPPGLSHRGLINGIEETFSEEMDLTWFLTGC